MFYHLVKCGVAGCLVLAGAIAQSRAAATKPGKEGIESDKSALAGPAVKTHPSAQDYQITRWTTEQGLPQNTVRCLLQTRDGYLWLGTRAGLARFDGVRMTIFDRANTPGMLSDSCVTLTEDADNNVWVGTEDGLLCRRQHRFIAFRHGPGGPSHGHIRTLSPGRDGGVWIGTENGLEHFFRGEFRRFTTTNGLQADNIRAVLEDGDGGVWVGTEIQEYEGGLQRASSDGQFRSLPNYGTLTPFMVNYITRDALGRVWWGNNQGLHCWESGRVTDFGVSAGLDARVVKWIHADSGGNLTVVAGDRQDAPGRRGLLRFRNGEFTRIELSRYGVEDDVICALEDFEGNIWAGTRTEGLIRLQPMRLAAYTVNDGLSHPTALSLCEAADDAIYVGTCNGLSIIKDGRVSPLQPKGKYAYTEKCAVRSVWPGEDGGIWEERGGPACYRVYGGAWSYDIDVRWPDPLQVGTLYGDRVGRLWIGNQRGVLRLEPASLTGQVTRPTGCPTNEVRAMVQDRAGRMWFGTLDHGLTRWADGQAVTFTTRDGLSSDRAWALLEDSEGVLWIGTDRGLNRIKDDRITAWTTRHGLFDDRIHCLLEDDFGCFWISGLHGIYRVKRRELQSVADGNVDIVHCVPYGEADGMPSSETSGGFQPSGWKARDGRLWFPTLKGVVVIDPKQIQDNQLPPPLVIEQVLADGEVVHGDGLLNEEVERGAIIHLRPGRARTLEIRYTANSFVAPERMRFRYRLDGHDRAWREAKSNERAAVYTNLRPGEYTFRVKACNNHGYWNEAGAMVAISLAPKFTETLWFPLSCALGLLVLSGGVAAWRLRWQHRLLKLEQQRALANERTRIARDLHDDLGTALTGLALELDVVGRETQAISSASQRLGETAKRTRDLAERMREVVWAVNPRCDTVSSLASFLEQQAAQFLHGDGIRGRLEFPEDIPTLPIEAATRHQLALGIREALTNVVRHAHATEVVLGLTIEDGALNVRVADNGCGFDVVKHSEKGHGLTNMHERLGRVGGKFEVASEPGNGTIVLFRVPLEQIPTRTRGNDQKAS